MSSYSRSICISTGQKCNLNCVYCYEGKKENRDFDIDNAIFLLSKILSTSTPNGTKIKLHGGEPFIEFDKIKRLCEELWNMNVNESFKIHITTNGTLIHGNIKEWLRANCNKIELKLSLDGTRTSHNTNRSGSFDAIDIPFFVETWPDIRVNMTVTPDTISNFSENVIFLHSRGFRNILTNFAMLLDWSRKDLRRTFYLQLVELGNFYLKNPNLRRCSMLDLDIERTLLPVGSCLTCDIGLKEAFELESNQSYPCHMAFPSICGSKELKMLREIDVRYSEKYITEKCRSCSFVNLCRTCYAENVILRGDVSKRDMSLCPYLKISFVVLFNLEYSRLVHKDMPTGIEIRKMLAIQKLYKDIKLIEEAYNLC